MKEKFTRSSKAKFKQQVEPSDFLLQRKCEIIAPLSTASNTKFYPQHTKTQSFFLIQQIFPVQKSLLYFRCENPPKATFLFISFFATISRENKNNRTTIRSQKCISRNKPERLLLVRKGKMFGRRLTKKLVIRRQEKDCVEFWEF
jgi:hypothetical protein